VRNVKITVQYDGTNYSGWQIQPGERTVQGELTKVLSLLDHRPVTVHGAGRTDAGAHAQGQVASFFLKRCFDARALREAINGNLDRDIRVFDVEFVDDSFHARLSAKRKTYCYKIWNEDVVSPFHYRYVFHFRHRLDLVQMQQAASLLVGTHDFSAFTVMNSEIEDRVRTLERLDVRKSGEVIFITAIANGFLRHMVRTIVGTLIEVGRGLRPVSSVAETLESRDRRLAGPTAPAAGLTLVRVDY
jgi:tRNA pseudouridine38-40 synthase